MKPDKEEDNGLKKNMLSFLQNLPTQVRQTGLWAKTIDCADGHSLYIKVSSHNLTFFINENSTFINADIFYRL